MADEDSHEFIKDIKEYFDEKTVETQRHFDIIAEDVKSEIQIVAEQVGANTEKLEEHDKRFDAIEDTLGIIKLDIEFIKMDSSKK